MGTISVGRGPRGPVEGIRPCPEGGATGTGSYLVSNLISPGWWRKGLKGKRLPSIKTEAFSERLAKGFVGTPKLSVLQWEQS